MAKFIILLFCAFFVVAKAQTQNTPGALQKIHDTVEASIISISDNVQSILDDAKEKSNEVQNNLKNQAEQLAQEMQEEIKKQLAETQKNIDDLIEKATTDVSECKPINEILEKVALETISNMSVCVTDKIEEGNGYTESMIKIAEDLKLELEVIRLEANDCIKNIDGIIATAKAIACVNGAGAKATWASMKKVPSVTQKIIQFSYLLTTLPVKLTFCTTTNGLYTFARESIRVTDQVKKCIKQKNSQ